MNITFTTDVIITDTQGAITNNNSDVCEIPDRLTGLWLNVAAVFGFIVAAVSAIGNGIIIAAFIKTKRLHKPPNILLTNLAMGDLLFGLLGSGFYFSTDYFHFLFCNEAFAKLRIFILSLLLCMSLNNITAVALERFIGIHFPFFYSTHMTNLKAYSVALGSWLFGISRAIAFAATYKKEMDPKVVLSELIILAVLLFFTLLIYCRVYKVSKRHLSMDKSFGIRNQQSKSQVAVLVALVNAISWLPLILVRTIDGFIAIPYWIQATFLAPYIGTCLNLVIYTYRMRDYRQAVRKLFRCNTRRSGRIHCHNSLRTIELSK